LLKGGGSAYIMRAPGQGTRKSLPSQTIFEHRNPEPAHFAGLKFCSPIVDLERVDLQ
jgi:hypothetical protein